MLPVTASALGRTPRFWTRFYVRIAMRTIRSARRHTVQNEAAFNDGEAVAFVKLLYIDRRFNSHKSRL